MLLQGTAHNKWPSILKEKKNYLSPNPNRLCYLSIINEVICSYIFSKICKHAFKNKYRVPQKSLRVKKPRYTENYWKYSTVTPYFSYSSLLFFFHVSDNAVFDNWWKKYLKCNLENFSLNYTKNEENFCKHHFLVMSGEFSATFATLRGRKSKNACVFNK